MSSPQWLEHHARHPRVRDLSPTRAENLSITAGSLEKGASRLRGK